MTLRRDKPRHQLALCVILCLTGGLAACKDSGSTTGPSTTGTVNSLSAEIPSIVRVGQSIQASATATKSDGSAQLVGTGWRSSNTSVATITDAGVITGVGNGTTTISVSIGGQQQQRDTRVLPDYEGTWTGTFRVDSCTPNPTAVYTWHCTNYAPGTTATITLTISQAGSALTGQFTAYNMLFTSFVVPINSDGGTALLGTNVSASYLTDALFSVGSAGQGRLTGTTHWERRGNSGLVGGSVIEGTILSLTRP